MRMRDIKPGMAVSTTDGVLHGITIGKPWPGRKYPSGKTRYVQSIREIDGKLYTMWCDHLKKL